MADVKSKNLYELLGNDHEEDSDKEPAPPTKAIDKTQPRTGKRNAPDAGASAGGDRGARGGRRGGYSGNDAAFHDRNAGSQANRGKPVDDGARGDDRRRRGGAPRGGRGNTFRDNRDDRHSRGVPNDHPKQAEQSWGGHTGGSEWDDEKAGEAIAKSDAKDPEANAAPDEAGAPEPEPEEDNSKSYDDYMAEQLAKRANLGGDLQARKPNEGSKVDKKWAQAKAINREEGDDAYIAPQDRKQVRQRERKEKQVVDIDHRFVEQPRAERGGRGGRGRGESTRGRGEGGRGRGEGRGRGRGGEFRGGRGGERGGERGGRGGGRGNAVNVSDTNAFPTLGS